jgi:hypothetical protein
VESQLAELLCGHIRHCVNYLGLIGPPGAAKALGNSAARAGTRDNELGFLKLNKFAVVQVDSELER